MTCLCRSWVGAGRRRSPDARVTSLPPCWVCSALRFSLKPEGGSIFFPSDCFFLNISVNFFFYILFPPPLILSLSITSQRIKGILLGLLFLTPVVGEDSINMPLVLVNMFYWLAACLNMLHTHCSLSLHLFCPSLTVCSLFTMSSLLGYGLGIFVYPSHPAKRL